MDKLQTYRLALDRIATDTVDEYHPCPQLHSQAGSDKICPMCGTWADGPGRALLRRMPSWAAKVAQSALKSMFPDITPQPDKRIKRLAQDYLDLSCDGCQDTREATILRKALKDV